MLGPLEIIIVACLASAPDDCREHRMRLGLQGGDAAQCAYGSPPRVSSWALAHPGWTIKSWRCAVLSEDEAA